MTTIVPRLRHHLERMGIPYWVRAHRWVATASETAEAAHVPGDRLAKAVLLADAEGPVLAVLPCTQKISLELLNRALRRELDLVPESQIGGVFDDCETGALPAAGVAYGLDVVVDDSLKAPDDVFFEAGDHRHIVHVGQAAFRQIMDTARWASFGIRQ